MLATSSTRLELEQENARLQRLVAELLARNQELRQALESATVILRLPAMRRHLALPVMTLIAAAAWAQTPQESAAPMGLS